MSRIDEIMRLREDGKTYSQIAAALGINRNTVSGSINRHLGRGVRPITGQPRHPVPDAVSGVHPVVRWLFEEMQLQNRFVADVAVAAGVHPQSIHNWRSGVRGPSFFNLDAVVNTLGYKLWPMPLDYDDLA